MSVNIFLGFYRAKSEMAAAVYFHMSVKVLYSSDDFITFWHIRTGPKGNRITTFSAFYACVWFMRIAPGRASVDKRFELCRHIRPVGGGNAYYDICNFKFCDDIAEVIILNTFSSFMAASASIAEVEGIVTDTYSLCLKATVKLTGYNIDYFCGGSVSYRTAIDNKCIHIDTPISSNKRYFITKIRLCQETGHFRKNRK